MNWERIIRYFESECYKEDLEKYHDDLAMGTWIDVSNRFNLCSGCICIGPDGRVDIFDTVFRVENYKIEQIEKLKEVIEGWDDVIKEMRIIMAKPEYQKLVAKNRGYIKFNRYASDGRALNYIELHFDRSLTDYVLDFPVIGVDSIDEQIEIINNIDDELYAVGEVFCKNLKSPIFSRYFSIKKDVGTGKYCIKLKYGENFKIYIEDIDQKLGILFGKKRKLYVKNAEELEVLMELIG